MLYINNESFCHNYVPYDYQTSHLLNKELLG